MSRDTIAENAALATKVDLETSSSMEITEPTGPRVLTKRGAFLVLTCTSAPSFMLQLDANIVSVSLPTIARSLNASFSGIEWVLTAYMLSFASLVLPAGALADRYGRKTLLIMGLSIFTGASFLCGAAPNLPVLIIARTLQGMGAAMQLSSALATLSHVFQGEARARAFAFWGAVVGIGIASGPVVGGLITQLFGWRWAFFVNLPIGAVLIAMIVKVIDTTKDPFATRLDWPGVACFGTALFLVTLALIEGNHEGWRDPWILAELGAAAVLFVLFVLVERWQARPMLDLSFFTKPTFLGANLAQFSFAAGMLTMLTFIPIFLQGGLGKTSGVAGAMMLPMVVPLFIVPRIISSYLAFRLSGRALLTIGLLLVSVGLLWLGVAAADLSYEPMIAGMLVSGVGAGILNGETTKVGMTVIPKERAGMASGLSGTVRFTGLVIGIAALGVVVYSRVAALIHSAAPGLDGVDFQAVVQSVTAGHLSAVNSVASASAVTLDVASATFASAYQWLFFAGSLFMLTSAGLTWFLVRHEDTPPIPLPSARHG